jgi:hypothetical protein
MIGITEYLKEHFIIIDHNGNVTYNKGLINGITVEKMFKEIGITFDKSDADGRELINRTQASINCFLKQYFVKKGIPAGSCGHNPTTYFIPQSRSEQKMILNNRAKAINGRLQLFKVNGKNLLEEKTIDKTQKLIENFVPVEEEIKE